MSRPYPSWWESLEPRARERLVQSSIARRFSPGELVCLTGDPLERVHVLERGIAKLTAVTEQGREVILDIAVPHALLDDLSLVDGAPQALHAQAVTSCDVMSIDARFVERVMHDSPAVGRALTTDLARRMRRLYDAFVDQATADVPARVAGRILDLAALMGRTVGDAVEVPTSLTQSDLARLAGTSRESTCKAMRHLRRQGLVDYDGRGNLRVLRPDALARLKCAGRASAPSP